MPCSFQETLVDEIKNGYNIWAFTHNSFNISKYISDALDITSGTATHQTPASE
jgi:hypothetical protein